MNAVQAETSARLNSIAGEPTQRVFERTDIDGLIELLQDTGLADRMTVRQQADLVRCSTVRRYQAGEAIYREGEAAGTMGIVIDGAVEISRQNEDGVHVRLAIMRRGQSLGEGALTSGRRRTADVRALRPTVVLMVDVVAARDRDWISSFAVQLVSELNGRMQRATDRAIAAMREQLQEACRRSESGRFMAFFVAAMSLYTMSIGVTSRLVADPIAMSLFTNFGLLIAVCVTIGLIRTSVYSAAFFGLIVRSEWRRQLVESAAVAIALSLLLTAVKSVGIAVIPSLAGETVIDPQFDMGLFARPWQDSIITVAYVGLCPVQELLARGVLQGAFYTLLVGHRGAAIGAVLVSNAMFAAAHAHVSVWLAIGSFGTGLVWGIMYHRHRSLLGVSLCHAIVGFYGLEVLGLWRLARIV